MRRHSFHLWLVHLLSVFRICNIGHLNASPNGIQGKKLLKTVYFKLRYLTRSPFRAWVPAYWRLISSPCSAHTSMSKRKVQNKVKDKTGKIWFREVVREKCENLSTCSELAIIFDKIWNALNRSQHPNSLQLCIQRFLSQVTLFPSREKWKKKTKWPIIRYMNYSIWHLKFKIYIRLHEYFVIRQVIHTGLGTIKTTPFLHTCVTFVRSRESMQLHLIIPLCSSRMFLSSSTRKYLLSWNKND